MYHPGIRETNLVLKGLNFAYSIDLRWFYCEIELKKKMLLFTFFVQLILFVWQGGENAIFSHDQIEENLGQQKKMISQEKKEVFATFFCFLLSLWKDRF